ADRFPQRGGALGDGLLQVLRVLSELSLGLEERRFGPFALGNVLNAQKDHLRAASSVLEHASIDQKGAAPDLFKVLRDFEVVEETAAGDDILHQFAQPGNIPLAVAQLKNRAALRFRRRDLEGAVERVVG